MWNRRARLEALTYRHAFWRRLCNTVFRAPWVYELFIRRKVHALGASYWAARKADGKRGIADYIALAPTSHPLLEEVVARTGGKTDAVILDLGCNVGRHLNALHERGYAHLYGVDVNASCAEAMRQHFNSLSRTVTVRWESFETFLPAIADDFFDVVFTHGKTIEHVHPGFRLVREVCRVTKDYVILGNVGFSTGSYPRFWIHEFERNGFALVKLLQPEREWAPDSPVNRPHSLAVFRKIRA